MKFSTVILSAGLATMVAAMPQAGSSSSVRASSTSVDPARASVDACLNQCDPADVNCRAHCLGNPVPNAENVSATNECEAKCPTSDGTAEANAALAACRDKCINNHYYTQTGVTADHTISAGYGVVQPTAAAVSGTDVTVTAPLATGTGATAAISSVVNSVRSSVTNAVSSAVTSGAAVVTTIKQATTISDASTTYVSTRTSVSTAVAAGTNAPSAGEKLHIKLSAAGVIGGIVALFAL